jgi:EAL domain-containing protein (putative c-di-GMP-specific phosphodiesterase class I)
MLETTPPNPQLGRPLLARLLLVGSDPAWHAVAQEAASRCGAALDVQPDVRAALASMLYPTPTYDHVMAVAPLRSRSIDALAGMLDEVTLHQTPLLLLGCATSGTATPMICIDRPSADAVVSALGRGGAPASRQALPPMQASELVHALHSGGLRMRFQPILRASDLAPIGLEALARLHHGQRGIMHPKDFIPLTIACGRERVLTGIAAARTFLEIGSRLKQTGLYVSLNLPLSTVMHDLAVERHLELCTVTGVRPADITIEVLESHTAPDFGRLRDALIRWREAGFRTAIDDAGPSLPHWRDMVDLPFDTLKLDGSMVADPAQHSLLEMIVAEARARGRNIVAEGVESQASLDRVMALGVDAVQGFMFARPLPALAVPIWVKHWNNGRTK